MIDIEEVSPFEANKKTNVVTIGEWTYYQNTHMRGAPAWACYFGKKHYCAIYEIDKDEYRLIVKEGDYFSKDCKVVKDCYTNSFKNAQSLCEEYMY